MQTIPRTTLLAAVAATLVLTGCDLFSSPETRIQRAAEHMNEGDYATAAIELRNALEKQPGNAQGRLLLAQVSLFAGDIASAQKELDRAREAGAKPADVAPVEASLLAAQGEWDALAKAMASPIAGFPEPARLDYLAQSQLGLGDPTAALATLDQAAAQKPEGDLALRIQTDRARAMAAAGDRAGALTVADQVLAEQPGDAGASLLKASLLLAGGDIAGAEKVLAAVPVTAENTAIPLRERVLVLGGLIEAQLALDDTEKAGQSADALAKIAPGSPLVPLLKGRIALADADPDAAVNQLQKAVQGAPDFPVARYWLAYAYLEADKSSLAQQELERVLTANPDNPQARKLLAEVQMRAGQPGEALESLQPLLAANTRDPAVYAMVGEARMMEGNSAAAEATIEQGLEAAPESNALKLSAAASYIASGDRERALELLAQVPDEQGGARKRQLQVVAMAAGKDKAVAREEIEALAKRNPKDAELQTLTGSWLASQGDFAAAAAYLKNAIALDPADGRAYIGLSQIAARRGDRSEATKWIAEWHKRAPDSWEATLRLAKMMFESGDDKEGMALANAAIAAHPEQAVVQDTAGRVLMEAGQNELALDRFVAASKLEPTNKVILFDVARVQIKLSRPEAARGTLEKALSLDANWMPAILALAQLDLSEGKTDDALELAARLKKSAAGPAAGYALEGDIYMAAKQFEKAVGAYAAGYELRPSALLAIGEYRARRAAGIQPASLPLVTWLKVNPKDMAARSMLGEAYQQDGDDTAAAREYEQVVAANPQNLLALNNLAFIYVTKGDKRAVETARKAYELAPQVPAVADTYGWALLKAGNTAEALKLLSQAAEKAKNVPEIQYHLGVALARSGKAAEAKKVLGAAVAAAGSAPWKADAERELAAIK